MPSFRQVLSQRILTLDGSMGALLQSRGLPPGMAPDVWMMDHPQAILEVQQEYVEAGADILITNTFGASRWRLDEYDCGKDVKAINAKAVEIARKASGGRAFVAGDIGPCGDTLFPTGLRPFDEAWEVFYEQALALLEAEVDLIVLETFFDSLEFRCALSAVREASREIPIIAHATFNTDGITDTGASPENIAAIAEGFHVDAVGVNCSTGPEHMLPVLQRMAAVTALPLSVQPNAGLPCLKDGHTHFPMDTAALKEFVPKFVEAGASVIGGCCGTHPSFIREIKTHCESLSPIKREGLKGRVFVSSLSGHTFLGGNERFVPIGERMNPSGRKKLSASLKEGNLGLLLRDAERQTAAGGRLLDLNVGVPLVDEPALMKDAVVAVQNKIPHIPLMIDSANSFALETGASVYYGRPLLNSINAEDEKLEEALPLIKKHGAAVVCLLTGVNVPEKAEDRLANGKKIADVVMGKWGFREEDLVFDCLGLVVSAMKEGSRATLESIALIKDAFPKAATTLGLSNTSFGLPNRLIVHNAFLACAVHYGLDSAIMSVTDGLGPVLADAAALWGPKQNSVENFMEHWTEKISLGTGKGDKPKPVSKSGSSGPAEPAFVSQIPPIQAEIFRSIVEGEKGKAETLAKEFCENSPQDAMGLFLEVMTPAIRHLGDLFAARVKFIPHLMAAAEAMKAGVAILEPHLIAARKASGEEKGSIVFATVKGDIHDIGKNICILMLRNYGYNVIDLGRNVDAELIIETGIKENAQVLALSALMTTTMMQMKVIVDAVKERNLPFKVVIGGAVVTPEFANSIQADGYSTDVGTCVSEMERVITLLEALSLPMDKSRGF